MREPDFWQDLDRTDSMSVALLGGVIAFIAVRGGVLVTEVLHGALPQAGLDAAAPLEALLVAVAFAVTFVVSVVLATVGTALTLWGAGRVVRATAARARDTARDTALVR